MTKKVLNLYHRQEEAIDFCEEDLLFFDNIWSPPLWGETSEGDDVDVQIHEYDGRRQNSPAGALRLHAGTRTVVICEYLPRAR